MNKNHSLLSPIIIYTVVVIFYALSMPFVILGVVFAEESIDTIAVGILKGVVHNPDNGNMHVVNDVSDSVFGTERIAIANAGPDQTVNSGDIVQLDGSDSSDLSDRGLLTYLWTQTSGPKVNLDNPTVVNPTFKVPKLQTNEDIVFQLTVTNDQRVESEPDNVSIHVKPIIPDSLKA